MAAQTPLRLQVVDYCFERRVLVRISIQGSFPHTTQQLLNRWIARNAGFQDQHVYKESSQRFQLTCCSARDGRAYRNFLLPTITRQQELESSQQRHEEGHTLTPPQGLQL